MLEQSQTITVSTVPRVYNTVEIDKQRVARRAELASGEESLLTVDHQKVANGTVNRHLHKLETGVVDTATDVTGMITITTVITAPKWVDEDLLVAEVIGFNGWVNANVDKTVHFRS